MDRINCGDQSFDRGSDKFDKYRRSPACERERGPVQVPCSGSQEVESSYRPYNRYYDLAFFRPGASAQPIATYRGQTSAVFRHLLSSRAGPCRAT